MSRFADRLDETAFRKDERVRFGVALPGQREEWLFHLSERLFARIQSLAEGYELHALPLIDPHDHSQLNLAQGQALADELAFPKNVSSDQLLLRAITNLESVIQQVTSSPSGLELVVEGP